MKGMFMAHRWAFLLLWTIGLVCLYFIVVRVTDKGFEFGFKIPFFSLFMGPKAKGLAT